MKKGSLEMSQSQREIIREEQRILDKLIDELDRVMLKIDNKYTYSSLQAKKAKEQCLPDTYGALIAANHNKYAAFREKKRLKRVRDELYDTRIVVDCTDDHSTEEEEIKIGLHTYAKFDKLYVVSWVRPVCRNYILDNCKEEYDGIVEKGGVQYKTHFKLKLKRRVDMYFDKIKDVSHLYPLLEEAEEIIADEFLKELLSRREEQEFKNIVFSIQKHQGEIIQTPFRQNLIVQGCAGSGKSMIMLHRLPILLYDNPNALNRNNLYIISPSATYIQMAENMRLELEIEDLKMGTLNQYWDYVIEKYGQSPSEYGESVSHEKSTDDTLAYVYSEKCINDIKDEITGILDENTVDLREGYSIFHINEETDITGTPAEILRKRAVQTQLIISKNKESIQKYYKVVKPLLEKLEDISRMLSSRKLALLRRVSQNITEEEKRVVNTAKRLEQYDEAEHKRMYDNARKTIEMSNKYIAEMKTLTENIESNHEYFDKLNVEAEKIDKLLGAFGVEKDDKGITVRTLYKVIDNKKELLKALQNIIISTRRTGNPYDLGIESVFEQVKGIIPLINGFRETNEPLIPLEYLIELNSKGAELQQIGRSITAAVYSSMMYKTGGFKNKKGKYKASSYSPYLYLQILYQLNDKPNSSYESLISIDEAQNLSYQELELIKNVNGPDLVFNLYGDVNQHVEGSKGIDSWDNIRRLAAFKTEYMRENYRNARQITVYCNRKFGMDMVAINLSGSGVRQFYANEDFGKQVRSLLQEPMGNGISCIIVKNENEAEMVVKHAGPLSNRINNMTTELNALIPIKWNLMTIDQAKGLEFETVFVLSGAMTKNEEYIAYTRALDKLIIHNADIPVIEDNTDKKPETEKGSEDNIKETSKPVRKKREKSNKKSANGKTNEENGIKAQANNINKTKKKNISIVVNKNMSNKGYFDNAHKLPMTVKEFFEQAGLEVVDMRIKKGCLWVVGDKEEIDDIVKKAVKQFGITGAYSSSSKALGYKPGWYTKSAK